MCQTACKPGSVRALRHETTIPLGRPLRSASRDQPGQQVENIPASQQWIWRTKSIAAAGRPYSVLLPVGFALPPLLPEARCALTAPFHPCPSRGAGMRCLPGGLFSVALSLGSPPPAVSRHRTSVEPGLSSATVPRHRGRPAVWRGCDAPGAAERQRGNATYLRLPFTQVSPIATNVPTYCPLVATRTGVAR
jgi:hypothetical protein